jgi:hypothetical protein
MAKKPFSYAQVDKRVKNMRSNLAQRRDYKNILAANKAKERALARQIMAGAGNALMHVASQGSSSAGRVRRRRATKKKKTKRRRGKGKRRVKKLETEEQRDVHKIDKRRARENDAYDELYGLTTTKNLKSRVPSQAEIDAIRANMSKIFKKGSGRRRRNVKRNKRGQFVKRR